MPRKRAVPPLKPKVRPLAVPSTANKAVAKASVKMRDQFMLSISRWAKMTMRPPAKAVRMKP